MALVRAFDDAKLNQVAYEGDVGKGSVGGGMRVEFFGTRDTPGLPHAALMRFEPARVAAPHFHSVDQFQVIVDGKGKLGRNDLTPYGVQFTRAYTAYGPLVSDQHIGSTLFVLHAHTQPHWGSHHLPQERDLLAKVPDRHPCQIIRKLSFPSLPAGTVETTALELVPGMSDELGLGVYTLRLPPNSKFYAPDATQGDGQYLMVVKGSLLHAGKEHKTLALVFVYPNEDPFQVHAGPDGMDAIVLNFPRPRNILQNLITSRSG